MNRNGSRPEGMSVPKQVQAKWLPGGFESLFASCGEIVGGEHQKPTKPTERCEEEGGKKGGVKNPGPGVYVESRRARQGIIQWEAKSFGPGMLVMPRSCFSCPENAALLHLKTAVERMEPGDCWRPRDGLLEKSLAGARGEFLEEKSLE